MKNSRLFQILYFLLDKKKTTAGELAKDLEVSVRTIYRDIDALSAAGVPIYTEKGQGGGIYLMEQFRLDRTLLGEEDQEQILTALQSLRTIGAGSSEVLSQLSGVFQKEAIDWLEVDFESWGAFKGEKEYFEICKQAILKRNLLTFRYYNSTGGQGERIIEPARLCFRGGNWYVTGYCRERNDHRMFRLNRMECPVICPEHFIPRPSPPEPEQKTQIPLSAIELRFTRAAAYRVRDSFQMNEIEAQPDGSYLVKAKYPYGEWVIGFILSFGKEVEVLKPEWLQKEIRKEIKKMQEVYET